MGANVKIIYLNANIPLKKNVLLIKKCFCKQERLLRKTFFVPHQIAILKYYCTFVVQNYK